MLKNFKKATSAPKGLEPTDAFSSKAQTTRQRIDSDHVWSFVFWWDWSLFRRLITSDSLASGDWLLWSWPIIYLIIYSTWNVLLLIVLVTLLLYAENALVELLLAEFLLNIWCTSGVSGGKSAALANWSKLVASWVVTTKCCCKILFWKIY